MSCTYSFWLVFEGVICCFFWKKNQLLELKNCWCYLSKIKNKSTLKPTTWNPVPAAVWLLGRSVHLGASASPLWQMAGMRLPNSRVLILLCWSQLHQAFCVLQRWLDIASSQLAGLFSCLAVFRVVLIFPAQFLLPSRRQLSVPVVVVVRPVLRIRFSRNWGDLSRSPAPDWQEETHPRVLGLLLFWFGWGAAFSLISLLSDSHFPQKQPQEGGAGFWWASGGRIYSVRRTDLWAPCAFSSVTSNLLCPDSVWSDEVGEGGTQRVSPSKSFFMSRSLGLWVSKSQNLQPHETMSSLLFSLRHFKSRFGDRGTPPLCLPPIISQKSFGERQV